VERRVLPPEALTASVTASERPSCALLGAFKTKELARAAIAKANYKNYLDKQKEKSAPQEGDDLREFSMEAITNLDRGLDLISSKGGGDSPCTSEAVMESTLQDLS
jgi:hypothetical protein